ncbi:hypothetical protein CYMTET_39407 [Cymbomonas tetramitiformis]|uniref:Uncharacterized protein n=1 Tax=Cymbomonas tetramitiformis TaxID=36881 RepID=A0AAE0CA54_9CHLO|nr:hypothetical protein CYMTET_39407 [Cymbomonas tetramitiformis]
MLARDKGRNRAADGASHQQGGESQVVVDCKQTDQHRHALAVVVFLNDTLAETDLRRKRSFEFHLENPDEAATERTLQDTVLAGLQSVDAHQSEVVKWPPGGGTAAIAKCGNEMQLLTRVPPLAPPRLSALRAANQHRSEPLPKLNLLVLFLDAISRRAFISKMPLASAALEELAREHGLELFQFFRYHSVGHSTGVNTLPLFCGVPHSRAGTMMPYWEEAALGGRRVGYASNLCEDWGSEYNFASNRRATGTAGGVDAELVAPFCLPPHYPPPGENPLGNFAGPYSIRPRCAFGRSAHEHLLDWLVDFAMENATSPSAPWLAHGMLIEGHEGTGEVIRSVDVALAGMLRRLVQRQVLKGDLDSTAVVLVADHGLHMGINFLLTQSGAVEHQLPMLFMLLPTALVNRSLHGQQGTIRDSLRRNMQEVITPYDVHATLKHLGSWPARPQDTTHGRSLFDVPAEKAPRSCAEAHIPHWRCQCTNGGVSGV